MIHKGPDEGPAVGRECDAYPEAVHTGFTGARYGVWVRAVVQPVEP
jgi:hypothetical protein